MSKAKNLFFGIAVAFAIWNIFSHGLSVQSGAIVLLVLVCFAINVYNGNQRRKLQEEADAKIIEKERIRQLRAEARRKQNRKHKQKNKKSESDETDQD